METNVLIVGAGPTGLALALSLEKQNIPFRIIDKAAGPGTASRAIAVQARTLEMYEPYGFAQDVVHAGLKLDKPTIWTQGKRRASVNFGYFGRGLSPYPFVLMYPQDEHEKLLISHLKTPIEREKILTGFTQDTTGVIATLANGEKIRAKYIAGCDGAHSAVRGTLGLDFPGGTYEQRFYVADVDADAIDHTDEFYFFLERRSFLLVFPLPAAGRFRLIGIVPAHLDREGITYYDIEHEILKETPLRVTRLHWFSTYHVHHRVAQNFRVGRAFLLGDAAHIHSPAGGQGMNTGIGDGFNLGWKLAHVLRGGPDAVLDTYDSERRGFAKKLVASTDRIFTRMVSRSPVSQFIRLRGLPYIVPFLMNLKFFRRYAFRTISQLIIEYRGSALSSGHVGRVRGGDRLPWFGKNYVPLHACAWQVHVYGTAHPDAAAYCSQKGLPLMVFPWTVEAARAGFQMGAIYLVRPDGYISYVGFHTTQLRQIIEKWAI